MATVTLLNGLVGGLIATIVMTVFMMALGDDSPPPTALFWSKYVGDGPPGDYMPQGMALHLIYGVVAAAVFVLLLPVAGVDSVSLTNGVLYGLGWGVVLFAGAAVFWMNIVLDLDPEPADVGFFLLFHLIYGAVLGAIVGYGPV
jgi:hypothetical protein